MTNEVIKDIQHRMHGAIEALHRDFKTLRTGRANAAMLDGVTVDYYGTPTPISQVASLKVPESSLILAEPWDKSMLAPIEKAIRNADLGLNPMTDGKVIRIPIPQLTEERRKELVKVVRRYAEEGRVAVRNVRRDAIHHLKEAEKKGEMAFDDLGRAEEQVQKITDEHTKLIDELLKHKEAEILEV